MNIVTIAISFNVLPGHPVPLSSVIVISRSTGFNTPLSKKGFGQSPKPLIC
jgi:hypothetical protein